MNLARDIEHNANGPYKRCGPHPWVGQNGLPHYQPDPRPPTGHTFTKRRTDMPSDHKMLFFTPELYRRYNSQDDDIALAADAEWEAAIASYHQHLTRAA